MARLCSICTHPNRDQIDRSLVAGEAMSAVAALFRVSEDALARHRGAHLPILLALARKEADQSRAIDLTNELHRLHATLNVLLDSCREWLADPDRPGAFTLDPRAEEVSVIYRERGANGRPVRKRAKLSALLARLEDAGVDVDRGETRVADPRDLILRTVDRLHAQLELLARVRESGELAERLSAFEAAAEAAARRGHAR